MTRWRAQHTALAVVAMSLMALAAGARPNTLGTIDFFGYKGLDVTAVRSALPFREGDTFPPANRSTRSFAPASIRMKASATMPCGRSA